MVVHKWRTARACLAVGIDSFGVREFEFMFELGNLAGGGLLRLQLFCFGEFECTTKMMVVSMLSISRPSHPEMAMLLLQLGYGPCSCAARRHAWELGVEIARKKTWRMAG
jgi:hypothetical protein